MSDATPTRVLLVDDHEDSVALYALTLGALGFRVATAATAEDALDLAQQCCPDAVVVDVCLRGTSGLELARRLRAQPETCAVAILVVTGDEHARQSAADVGADRFLLKPLLPFELSAAIAAAVDERRRGITAAAVTSPAASGAIDAPA